MGLKANFTSADISKMLDSKMKNLEKAIIMRLSKLGERCVNEARSSSSYIDRTGNLRSSIGYVIMADGKEVSTNFLKVKDGEDGLKNAKSLADHLSSRFKTGYALIVVAGMDYAFYVEATGRNVLSSAEHLAETQLPIMLAQLKKKL